MKKLIITRKKHFTLLTCMVVALTTTACSDDKPEKAGNTVTAQKTKVVHNPFDHSRDVEVTDAQENKFEHDFAEQCVQRELRYSSNQDVDKERFAKPCLCIAKFLMKDLTAVEAEKFIVEHENVQSLKIKYENAAYHCVQEKQPVKEPSFSRSQQ